jgi:hypothetical protein
MEFANLLSNGPGFSAPREPEADFVTEKTRERLLDEQSAADRVDSFALQRKKVRQLQGVGDSEVMKMIAIPFALFEPVGRAGHRHSTLQESPTAFDRSDIRQVHEDPASRAADPRDLLERVERIKQMLDNHHRKHHIELRVVEGKIFIQIAQYELDVTWDCPDIVSIDDVDDRVCR